VVGNADHEVQVITMIYVRLLLGMSTKIFKLLKCEHVHQHIHINYKV
jgi:hypothetical protein